MKNLTETTTTELAATMILKECGDYGGRYQDEAFDILNQLDDVVLEDNCWCDIMFDRSGNVYAIWCDDSLDSFNGSVKYVELEVNDCPDAFKDMEDKI